MTDHVEPDLKWEQQQYDMKNIDFSAYQLRSASESELISTVGDADVLVVDQVRLTESVLRACPDLKLVIRHGDGYDNVDVPAASSLGIAVANKPGFWSEEVADHALMLVIALTQKLQVQQRIARRIDVPAGSGWDIRPVFSMSRLRGLTAGIVGFGKTGRSLGEKLTALGLTVLATDPCVADTSVSFVSLEELLQRADVVSLHVPATESTRGLFNAETFGKMKRGAVLINCSRGTVVNTMDLLEALEQKHIGGAGLDTTDPEPLPPDHPLLSLPNVIVTPHLAWYSEDALWEMRRSIVSDVIAMKDGQLPASTLNRDVLDGETPSPPGYRRHHQQQ